MMLDQGTYRNSEEIKELLQSYPFIVRSHGLLQPPSGDYLTANMIFGKRLVASEPYNIIESVYRLDPSGNVQVVQAIDLLPKEIQFLYPYAPIEWLEKVEYLNCLSNAIFLNEPKLIHQPNFSRILKQRKMENYRLLGEDESKQVGDIVYFEFVDAKDRESLGFHACTYIGMSDKGELVFNKAGTGPTNPYYLQTLQVILDRRKWLFNKEIEIKYYRMKKED